MSDIPDHESSPRTSQWFTWTIEAIVGRLHGPGGYYNAGNLLGLAATLAVSFATGVQSGAAGGSLHIVFVNLAGSPAAVAMTAATAIFLVSGEMYHRAWAGRCVPDAGLTHFADALSAIGGLALTISLLFIGQWGLAVASGLLTVGGKLGSALFGDDSSLSGCWPAAWVDPFRSAVLVGRVCGVMAAGLDFGFRVLSWTDGSLPSFIQSGTLVACYLVWIKADLLLVRARGQRQNENGPAI